ncbi:MAG: molybdenum cofactor biosynthesis protein MoaE [Acidimicrobiales bacterium]|nr:molybdenum cofactor biosynthesis protein MoaE [Acidimicrobiales bacterium]
MHDEIGQSGAAREEPAPAGDVWLALTTAVLSMDRAGSWVQRGDCGAVVVFGGTVRDHAKGRPGVSELEYEAYAGQVEPRLAEVAAHARKQWAGIGKVVIWHRTGTLGVGECSVVVAVSAGHRGEAFDAARYCIDTVKKTVPIWKRERWQGGEDWGLDAQVVAEVGE